MQRFLPWLVILVALGAVAWLAVPMLLEPGGSGEDVERALERSPGEDADVSSRLQGTGRIPRTRAATQGGSGRIHGKVVGPDGKRVAGVAVEARPWPLGSVTKVKLARRIRAVETGRPVDLEPLAESRTDQDGTFDLAVPLKRRFRVRARPEAGRCSSSAWADLTYQDEAEVTVHVLEASPLDGRVLGPDGAGVQAVITAQCFWERTSNVTGAPIETTAETGAFRITDLPAGRWKVAVRIPGLLELTGLEVKVPHEGVWTIRLDEETGRVVGTITNEDDVAIANAQILVHTSLPGSTRVAKTLATTDAEGHYEMAAVPTGKIGQVEVLHQGYLAYSAKEPLAPWNGTTVKGDEETRLDLVLKKGAVVEGRIFDIQDDSPLANARVMALAPAAPGQWVGTPYAEATSGQDGRYRLEGVPRGRVFLLPTHPTHYLPGLGEARTRTLRRENMSMQVRVPPPGLLLVVAKETEHRVRDLGLTKGAGVTGIVLDPGGTPVEGARVEVVGTNATVNLASMGFTQPGRAAEVILTDDAGRFEILNLPPSQEVTFKATKSPYIGVPSDPVTPQVEGPLPEIELEMQVGAVLEGHVVDQDGEGLSNVRVYAWAQLPGGGNHNATTQSQMDGSFRLEGAPFGEGTLQAWRAGFVADTEARIPFKDVRPGEVRGGFELKLSKGVHVSGVLVNEDDKPVVGQAIVLSSNEGRNTGSPVTTDGEGRFTFESAPAGRVRLMVSGGDTPWQPGAPIGKPFEAPAEDLRFVYQPPLVHVIEGRVLDPHGKPVPVCRVLIREAYPSQQQQDFYGPMSAYADDVVDGTFRRVVHGDGPWKIEVTEPQDLTGTPLNLKALTTTIESLSKSAITLRLEPGDEVRGRVLGEDGRGMPGVIVESGTLFAFSDSAGRFVLRGLAGEGATLTLGEVKGYVTPKGQTITSFDEEVVFHLEPAASIRGRLVDPDGKPVTNGYILAQWKSPDGRTGNASTMTQGGSQAFEIKGLPRDAVAQLTAQSWTMQGGQLAPVVVKDVPAGTTDLVITIGGGVEISGTVVDEAGEPFTKGWVRLTRTDDESQNVPYGQIQKDGTFRMRGIAPGRYMLSLQRNGSGPLPKPQEIMAPATGVRVVVPRGGVVAGSLIGDTSFEGFRISLHQEGAGQGYAGGTRVASDGTFRLEGVGEGTYTLQARKSNDAFYGLLEGIHAGDENVEVHLQRGLSIAGTLLDASGNAVAKGWISVSREGWTGSATVEDGRFEVRGLVPGTYKLRAAARTGNNFSGWTELGKEEAGSTGLTLRLK